MRWIKSSERLPENMALSHWRDVVESKPIDLSTAVNLLDCGCHDVVEWLDESEPSFTSSQILQAAKEGEVSMVDAKHIVEILEKDRPK
jgi:hypothetical protein